MGCDGIAGMDVFESAVAAFLGVVNDRDQVARGVIAHGAAREDQAALALVNHLVAVTVAAVIERDPGLAGYIGALIAGWPIRSVTCFILIPIFSFVNLLPGAGLPEISPSQPLMPLTTFVSVGDSAFALGAAASQCSRTFEPSGNPPAEKWP